MKKIIVFLVAILFMASTYSFNNNATIAKAIVNSNAESAMDASSESELIKIIVTMQIGNPNMTIDGSQKPIDNSGLTPVVIENRILIPVRALVDALKGEVIWNNDSRSATILVGQNEMILTLDSKSYYLNGEKKEMDVPPSVNNSRTLMPVRLIAEEAFGCEVNWDSSSSTATITRTYTEQNEVPVSFSYIKKDENGNKQLMVNNKPFIVTGAWGAAQIWGEKSVDSKLDPFADYAEFIEASSYCNFTVAGIPAWWNDMEKTQDHYDFSKVEFIIKEAEKNNIKIVLQFIGFNIASGGNFAPPYINSNTSKYSRFKLKNSSLANQLLCPNDPDTVYREKLMYTKLMEYLYKYDKNRTVILIRYSGEVGYGYHIGPWEGNNSIFGSNNNVRCVCDACNAKWAEFNYYQDSPERENKFMGVQYANYMDQVISAGKKIYPTLPVYTDVINNVTWPGWAYEQDPWLFKEFCPSFDFIGITDAHTTNIDSFVNNEIGELAKIPENIPFVSECPLLSWQTSLEAIGFLDVVNYGGIGGMYFDFTGPETQMGYNGQGISNYFDSIVRSEPHRALLKGFNSSYKALNELIATYKKTDKLGWWFANRRTSTTVTANGLEFNITKLDRNKSRGIIIGTAQNEFYICAYNNGKVCDISWDASGWNSPAAEKGYYEDGKWISSGEVGLTMADGKIILTIDSSTPDYKEAGYRIFEK